MSRIAASAWTIMPASTFSISGNATNIPRTTTGIATATATPLRNRQSNMRFSYVKPLLVGKAIAGLVISVEVLEDHTGQAASEATQGFGGRIAVGQARS
jgi:hypothetical protein